MLTTETVKPSTNPVNPTNGKGLAETLLHFSTGMYQTQAIYVAAKLGIADLLQDGAKSIEEIAQFTDTDEQSLYLVLRALASIDIFSEDENQKFYLTPLANYLKTDFPGSLRAFAIFLGEPWHTQVWGDILTNVKTGTSAFENVFGMPLFPYLKQHPELAQTLSQGMASLAASCTPAILASYNFSAIGTLVNVAGGQDALLAGILKMNPFMKGILFDLPPAIEKVRPLIEAKGVIDRCEILAGNFLESVPGGGDAYIMKSIIHELDADRAMTILKNCHRAMSENAKLLLLEKVIPPGNQRGFSKWLDLEMLVMGRGRGRTEAQYREFLAEAGFTLTRVFYSESPINVIEAVKA
jgi:hypothetical protein